ncbi:hypothetical protein FDJ57_gp05 [Gordonia phage Sour]|uniref:Uncharacterized protein n=1 Tax=Gordonia phage Sour TaxID=2182349 RepID=A0A2U8ULB9_9CAUD|nr:hypothetical protein FDJ57_gp05 [Gordonia phage Sour]AWN04281.1 hypothetical protein PBI_SOUR_5 [Gordonia phage Sour]
MITTCPAGHRDWKERVKRDGTITRRCAECDRIRSREYQRARRAGGDARRSEDASRE